MTQFIIYTDGSYNWQARRGGWAALVIADGSHKALSGKEGRATSQRMELLAAIQALEAVPEGAEVVLRSDSEYLINTMNGHFRRRANLDLWQRLDELASKRSAQWEWVPGHTGLMENEYVNALADYEAGVRKQPPPPLGQARTAVSLTGPQPLTHLDQQGHARMVDVGRKPETEREAVAKGSISMRPETLALIKAGGIEKGDVLATARLAGVMGAKQTPHLIPLCHPLPLSQVVVELEPDEARSAIHITATARATARTGVEMEALTAVVTAALTIYDMCKAVDRAMRIGDVRLVRKRGGKSGDIVLE